MNKKIYNILKKNDIKIDEDLFRMIYQYFISVAAGLR